MEHSDLKARIGGGLLSFPVTPFTADGAAVDLPRYQAHIAWLSRYPAAALFAAGGTGEFFSLRLAEVVACTRAAKEASGGMPIIAGCGYGTEIAVELARELQAAGADGLLLLPQYLVNVEQAGLCDRVERICRAVDIGVILYNRDNAVLGPAAIARLCEACPNLIGFKDGHGDVELVTRICTTIGERLAYIGGMPTAELYAKAYRAAGVTTYSSAVFNFVPEQALAFYEALAADDEATVDRMLRDFFYPYVAVRDRGRGYAVSIIKAGLRLVGRDPGPVRSPLTDLTEEEHDLLAEVLRRAFGPSVLAAAA